MANIPMGSAGSPKLQPYPRTPEGQGCITDNDKYLKYKGVRKRKWGKWVSEVRLPNSRERIWLGSFDTPQKAARAFDAAQFCLRGRCARFNFPDDPPHIPGGESLSPHEIQVVAARFANEVEIGSTPIATDDDQRRQEKDIIDHNNYNTVNTNENSSHVSSSNEEQSQNSNRYGQGHYYNDVAQGDMVTDGVTGWSFSNCLEASDATNANNFDPLFYDDQMSYISGHEFFNPAVPAPQDNDISREGYHYYSHINGDDESISQQQYSSFLWNF